MKVDGRFAEIRMMTSTGLMVLNTPENILQRDPTEWEMRLLSELEDSRRRRCGVKGARTSEFGWSTGIR